MPLNLDFVDFWKTASIVVTGGFALLGVLTETRDSETRKLTAWGKFSIGMILAAAGLGAAAQILETQADARKASADTKATLLIVQSLQRSLAPLDESPGYELILELPCREPAFRAVCRDFESRHERSVPVSALKTWPAAYPLKSTGWAVIAKGSYLRFGFAPKDIDADWTLGENMDATVSQDYGASLVIVLKGRLQPHHNKGEIQSVLDLRGRSLTFVTPSQIFDLKPLSLQLLVGGGQRVVIEGKDLVQRKYGDRSGPIVQRGYVHTFDSQADPRLKDEYSIPLLSQDIARSRQGGAR